jgi:hypothetical protein
MAAVMTLLGEVALPEAPKQSASSSGSGATDQGEFAEMNLGVKALKWIQKNGITRPMLDEVFHKTEAGVEVTAAMVPGVSKREMTVNVYLLSGIRGLLQTDVSTFDDSDAITLCKRLTAYDKNNHPANRQAVGNRMTGTKPTFTLTAPGETAAGDLLKLMAQPRGS